MAERARKTDSSNQTDGLRAVEHLVPFPECEVPSDKLLSGKTSLGQLSEVLFPHVQVKYPGRVRAMAELLGLSPLSFAYYSKPAGNGRLPAAVFARAEKICTRYIEELTAIREALETRRLALEAKKPKGPWRGGMFQVRVRDESGVPRTGLARDGWRKKKEPF
jgi:hypothetical protein